MVGRQCAGHASTMKRVPNRTMKRVPNRTVDAYIYIRRRRAHRAHHVAHGGCKVRAQSISGQGKTGQGIRLVLVRAGRGMQGPTGNADLGIQILLYTVSVAV